MADNNEKKDSYLEELYKAYDYSTTEFDKSLTFVSSGILAVSFAFIEKLVPLAKANFKETLVCGWYILAIAIFISVLAHFVNIQVLKSVIKNYKPVDDDAQTKTRKRGETTIQLMNITTLILILIGSLKIIYFIKLNI